MNRRNFLKGLLASTAVVALAPLAPVVEVPVSNATFVSFDRIALTTLNKYRPIFADNLLDGRIRWEALYTRKCTTISF